MLILLFTILIGYLACSHRTKSNKQVGNSPDNVDTAIVRKEIDISNSEGADSRSRSCLYSWLAGKDTLDFQISVNEYLGDSTLFVHIHHQKPIPFDQAIARIKECYPLILEDFQPSKPKSLYFKPPIYYLDLAKDLSASYEQQFGQENINYNELNTFLLNSGITGRLDSLIMPFGKKVKRYAMEKFNLMKKEHYGRYLPNTDLTEYPEFVMDGMGLYVELE